MSSCDYAYTCDCDDKTVTCGRSDCVNNPKNPVKPTTKSQKLANDHWAYIKDLLVVHGMTDIEIKTIGFHYKTAFIHGWKHGVEYSDEKQIAMTLEGIR